MWHLYVTPRYGNTSVLFWRCKVDPLQASHKVWSSFGPRFFSFFSCSGVSPEGSGILKHTSRDAGGKGQPGGTANSRGEGLSRITLFLLHQTREIQTQDKHKSMRDRRDSFLWSFPSSFFLAVMTDLSKIRRS